jgi:hypothetical protein
MRKNAFHGAAIAALILGSVLILPPMAQAQSIYVNPGGWFNDRFDGRFDGRFGFHRQSRMRMSQLQREIAMARTQIHRALSRGHISSQRAAVLSARLDRVAAQAQRMALNGGGLGPNEFSLLQNRIQNVRLAIRSGGFRYF